MRFKNYLLKDDKIKTFCSLQIKLVDDNTNYIKTIDFVNKKYKVSLDIDTLLNEFNNRLKNIYKGKYKFNLCLNEGIIPNDLKKLSNSQKKKIKAEWYRVNDEFAKMQKVLEKHLQNNIGGQ